MLRFGLISRVPGRRKANSQGMNRFFKNAHSRDQMSIKNSVNLELDALVQKLVFINKERFSRITYSILG